jgi:hypothetical protein
MRQDAPKRNDPYPNTPVRNPKPIFKAPAPAWRGGQFKPVQREASDIRAPRRNKVGYALNRLKLPGPQSRPGIQEGIVRILRTRWNARETPGRLAPLPPPRAAGGLRPTPIHDF